MTSGIEIRKASPLEAGIVYGLIETSWLAHYRKFMPLRTLLPYAGAKLQRHITNLIVSPTGLAWIARDHGQPVGTMTCIRRLGFEWVDDLFVLPGHTSGGVGSALLGVARSRAVQRGVPLQLEAMAANVAARRFYETHGGRLWRQKSEACWSSEIFPVVTYRWQKP